MKKIVKGFIWVLAIIYGLNALYILFFMSSEDDFDLLVFEGVSKWTAGFSYLVFAIVLFLSIKFEKKKEV
ncbi:hypothetical protein LV85_00386 [Algoriphagus chordae]|uniref:Uncharacterized protein n=1 Tax=Algoriphagus chordae TaxID=237019 RepID=A0A2W7RIH7_9BACT|nr:hypothetical protein LV85_00386 [Algoriphagus chordae]